MYRALYRKYRPAVFSDVCGQEHITSVLKYEAEHGKVTHAYLFCGSRGTGKTTCAKILAKAVNCENPVGGDPCGVCPSCQAIASGTATDVLEMDAASNNGVDYIRDIRDEIAYTPSLLKRRIYIIDEVHMLSAGAFNALLKTLEEPPEHAMFILATTELHKIPATIVSRCQQFVFRRIPVSVIADRLETIAREEQMDLDRDAAELIARLSEGGMRDAISLLDVCSSRGERITIDLVTSVAGAGGYDDTAAVVRAIAAHNIGDAFLEVERIYRNSSLDITSFMQNLTAFYRDMLIYRSVADPKEYLNLTEHENRILASLAPSFSAEMLSYHARLLDETVNTLSRASYRTKRLIAEMALLRMCDGRLDQGTDAILARLSALEDKIASGAVASAAKPAAQTPTEERAPQTETPSEAPTVKATPAPSTKKTEPEVPKEIPLTFVSDFEEAVAKIREADAPLASFLEEAEAVTDGNGTVIIRLTNAFGATMANKDKAKERIKDALRAIGVAAEEVRAERVASVRKKDTLDELL